MGTRQKLYDGLLVLDEGIADFANLTANTGTALTSSYQQANPKPGIPRANADGARTAIRVSGEQGTDLIQLEEVGSSWKITWEQESNTGEPAATPPPATR